MIAVIVILLILVALAAFVVGIYNKLVALKAKYENAFAQIDVQLKRRYDLIPNLVEVAKSYLKHENETLLKVVEARNAASKALEAAAANPSDPSAIEALNKAETSLAQNMRGLNVQLEAYPELKANTVMLQLSEDLTSTENRVAFARQAYNDAVMGYNVQRNSFPANLVAASFGHSKDAALLTFADAEAIKEAPKVSFS